MPRPLPPLFAAFCRKVDIALMLVQAAEVAKASAPKSGLSMSLIEALYELAYLRIFLLWEEFLEESFLRCLCGYKFTVAQKLKQPAFKTLDVAKQNILSGQRFVSWYDPAVIAKRASKFVDNGAHESVINSNASRLFNFTAVRHRIAHSSAHAKIEFGKATMTLAGRRYRGASAGRFLRDIEPKATPQARWLQTIGEELKHLARQII